MSDEKSTPLSSLNNKGDDSNVVNQILDKYNSLEQNPEGTLPPQDKNIPVMEEQFENRDLNKQMFQMASDNTQYKQHADSEQARIQNYEQPPDDDSEYEDEYEEYEMEEMPLWKKIVNEIRVPLIIFGVVVLFMLSVNDSMLVRRCALLGDNFNDINTTGFLVKAFLCAIVAYILIRFIRV